MGKMVITLKEAINVNSQEQTKVIYCDKFWADSMVPNGLVQYEINGVSGYMPIHNILGICEYQKPIEGVNKLAFEFVDTSKGVTVDRDFIRFDTSESARVSG